MYENPGGSHGPPVPRCRRPWVHMIICGLLRSTLWFGLDWRWLPPVQPKPQSWPQQSTKSLSCPDNEMATAQKITHLQYGTVHEGRLHKIAKNWLPHLSEKCPNWLNPLSPCPCGNTVNLKKSEIFYIKKCVTSAPEEASSPLDRKMSAHEKSPSTLRADVLYGQTLILKLSRATFSRVFLQYCGD